MLSAALSTGSSGSSGSSSVRQNSRRGRGERQQQLGWAGLGWGELPAPINSPAQAVAVAVAAMHQIRLLSSTPSKSLPVRLPFSTATRKAFLPLPASHPIHPLSPQSASITDHRPAPSLAFSSCRLLFSLPFPLPIPHRPTWILVLFSPCMSPTSLTWMMTLMLNFITSSLCFSTVLRPSPLPNNTAQLHSFPPPSPFFVPQLRRLQ